MAPHYYGFITICILAILLNSAVIYLFLTKKFLRNMYSNIFLFSLAISDLCYVAVTVPLLIKCEQLYLDSPGVAHHQCYAYEYATVFFGYCTVYHIQLAIAEKLCAICFTFKHHSKFCRSIAVKFTVSVWLFSAILTHIPAWWDYAFPSDRSKVYDKHFFKFHFATGFALPLLISTVMYCIILHKIFTAANRRLGEDTNRNRSRMHTEKKAALTFAIMLAAFVFSWSTWFIARIDGRIGTSKSVYIFLTTSRFLDPVFNPILYTFLKNDFRRAFLTLVWRKEQSSKFLTSRMRMAPKNNHGGSDTNSHEHTTRLLPYSKKRMATVAKENSPSTQGTTSEKVYTAMGGVNRFEKHNLEIMNSVQCIQ